MRLWRFLLLVSFGLILIFPAKTGAVYLDNLHLSPRRATGALTPALRPAPLPTATAVTPKTATFLRLKPIQDKTSVYSPIAFTVETDGVAANPFDPAQFDLHVRFTSPSKETLVVPAFWYQAFDAKLQPQGQPGWRVRFTPPGPGQWQAQAELARPRLISPPVTFTVTHDATARGFVRLHPQNSRYFAFDNGDLYFPIGLNIAWSNGDVLADYTRWFDRLRANGGNVARIWMASWFVGLEWKDTGLGDYSKRLKQAWLLDQIFQLAEERGITIMLCLLNHGAFSTSVNPEWADNPYNVANGGMLKNPAEFVTNAQAKDYFKRRLRYIAARWSYSPSLFAWEWWNEINWTPISDAQLAPWITEMTQTLRQFDPYNHLVTHSYGAGSGSHLWQMPELSFAQQHDYSGADPAQVFATVYQQFAKTAPGKPVLVGEHGYSPEGETMGLDQEPIHLHTGIWAAPFLGYAGSALYWWWDGYVDPYNHWNQFKSLAAFLADEELPTLTPATAQASSADALALTLQNETRALLWIQSRAYSIAAAQAAHDKAIRTALKEKKKLTTWRYEPPMLSGLTVTLTGLVDDGYTVYWYAPQTGEWLTEETVEIMNGRVTLTAPEFARDLAVKIIRSH